jgi:mannose-6-phosphate isomerase
LRALHGFIVDRALPLWADTHHPRGAFAEYLHMDGSPDHSAVRRMRVQARQIYVYSHATVLGLTERTALVVEAFERMVADYWHGDGGFFLSVNADGSARDVTRAAYDQAFGILAMAWLYRLTTDRAYLRWIDKTLRFMDEALADRRHGGYADSVGAPTRCQNPHMHLFEALMEAFAASADESYLVRADALFGLFQTAFMDWSIPALREYFAQGWLPDPERGDWLDPGHQLEWVWLLARYRSFRPAAQVPMDALFDFAARHATAEDGLIVDEVSASGTVLRGTKRLWPQTEHLKALVARYETGLADAAALDRVCGLMQLHYLNGDVGTWNDVVGENGARLSSVAPASSFYHLFLAYAEAMRATESG